jgi:hypothetical protein
LLIISRSLKATIPQGIVDHLQIKKTDVPEWDEYKKDQVIVRNLGTPVTTYKKDE